jgi:hypothetical protein
VIFVKMTVKDLGVLFVQHRKLKRNFHVFGRIALVFRGI